MKLIFGLGNPENKYKGTRHNIGFEVINKLAYDYNIPLKKVKHRAVFGDGIIAGKKVLLIKPQTYMNLSGECVRDMLAFYNRSVEDIIVVYDDIAFEPGDIRIREKGSAGSHNGVKNILRMTERDDFVRVRVGIGEKPEKYDLADYVLSRFTDNEMPNMINGITKAGDAVCEILLNGVAFAMNKFNGGQEKK
ncbi:MAG: aminoacyl-tRNA hydrolase [Defluviitaleaceae bacterium]|nr:aminoacyl-tRNA hydrolase [Defluviitaleaceae bacterium]